MVTQLAPVAGFTANTSERYLVTGPHILGRTCRLNRAGFDQIGDLTGSGIILAIGAHHAYPVYRGSWGQSGHCAEEIHGANGRAAVVGLIPIQPVLGHGGIVGEGVGVADVEFATGDGRTWGQRSWNGGRGGIGQRIDGGQRIGIGVDAEGIKGKTGVGDEPQGVGGVFGDGCRDRREGEGVLSGDEPDLLITHIEDARGHAIERIDRGDDRSNFEGGIIGLGIQGQRRNGAIMRHARSHPRHWIIHVSGVDPRQIGARIIW